jgi:hypothetical protein
VSKGKQRKRSATFISYSHDSVEHMERVLKLSDRLRGDGVNCVIDQYEESPPQGWPRWMDKKIRESKFVVLVCTELYWKKVMGEVAKETGLGVKWEGNLIYQHIYNMGSMNTGFVPIVFDQKDTVYIPTPLQGATYYCVADDAGYDALYRRLTNQHRTPKPKLGKRKPLRAMTVNSALYIVSPIDIELWNAAMWRGTVFLWEEDALPVLCVGFLHEGPARKIFEQWRQKYGEIDRLEDIRVSIVEGPVHGEEGYSVHIGPNHESVMKQLKELEHELDGRKVFFTISRIQRMTPKPGSRFLEIFKQEFIKHKRYILAPAIISEDGVRMEPFLELGIEKTVVHFRNVSDLGENDIDSIVLHTPKDSVY